MRSLFLLLALLLTACSPSKFIQETGGGMLTGAQQPDEFLKCATINGQGQVNVNGFSPAVSGGGNVMGAYYEHGLVVKGKWSDQAKDTMADRCNRDKESVVVQPSAINVNGRTFNLRMTDKPVK